MGCRDNSVPLCVPVSMLLTAKLSGYLLSLLLASVFFFTGSESLSESQILLLLRADTQIEKPSDSHTKTKLRPVKDGFIHRATSLLFIQ